MRATARPWRVDPVLLACVALAALLRLWGIRYGLPYSYNPDEVSIMSRALSLAHGGLNPHNFVYPSLYFYVLAGTVGAYFAGSYLLGQTASLHAFETTFWTDPSGVYLVGRLLSATAGVLTVVVVYALARKVGERALARSAAVLMTAAYIPVRDAHFVKHDVPVTLVIGLAALAAWRLWQLGRVRDHLAAGVLAGAALALHYYALFAAVPVVAAHLLRVARGASLLGDRRPWIAAAGFAAAFACLSPYVLIDVRVAARDIAANRRIVIDRALTTYGGWLGTAREHVRLFATQGAGVPMLVAAAVGAVALARRSPAAAIWLFSFPVAFFLFISNAWPFGRLENPLYPFLAVAAAAGIRWLAHLTRRAVATAAVLTLVCAAQPLWLAVTMDRLMSRTDTRTIAKVWIEANLPPGSGVAVQPYSVPLNPTRERLAEALSRNAGGVERAGYRFRSILALTPYPAPAYRLYYLGTGGLDQDKIYYDPGELSRPGRLEALHREGLRFIVLKRLTGLEDDPVRDRVASVAHLAFRVSPFRHKAEQAPAQLPDYDVRPSLEVERPGPIIEVWQLEPAKEPDHLHGL